MKTAARMSFERIFEGGGRTGVVKGRETLELNLRMEAARQLEPGLPISPDCTSCSNGSEKIEILVLDG